MKIKIAALAATLLTLTSACSSEQADPRVESIRDKAPSWSEYTDKQLLDELDKVCLSGQPSVEEPPSGVTLHDYAYLQGLALATCED